MTELTELLELVLVVGRIKVEEETVLVVVEEELVLELVLEVVLELVEVLVDVEVDVEIVFGEYVKVVTAVAVPLGPPHVALTV
ncbi:MAG: hypothetical protein JRM86_05270 [Nitrososphaerota archaeon]|nr:hypothetical protein [Nitrososphaerota archaeon]